MPPTPGSGGSRIVIDCGQTGSRLRIDDGPDRDAAPVYTDRPVVEQVAALAREAVSAARSPVTALAAGVSGLTEQHARADVLLGMLTDLGVATVVLAHDSVSAYLAANGFAEGVTCAVGTGVVTLGVGPAGVARVDGWGHLYGDAGSGYWIGRAGIEAALRDFDGRGTHTALTRITEEVFGSLPELYMVLQGSPDRVSRTAAFAKRVDAAAAGGDVVAQDICRRAAAELATSAGAALTRSGWSAGRPARISWMGNVLARSELIRDTFIATMTELAPGATIGPPGGTTLDGVTALLELPAGHPLGDSVTRAGPPGR
ncbi:ATPase BadF/BadG/BcrA/BcrD type [Gordonia bronchialis DSM 43247]|uniref:ATPase BadF/BadG/BcrA/BcrD type n=1 Tax=Gordonia bronchialis (strain ATCC 25592 / DSM 43247 / BCRC 13721 / JCM 3198 / KCTC 3076 / NBRC 16047 / NCTC 10667) TaxID=526226 RepID=D0L8W7_GORB4|nr:BadF/BadG/BcrA/BcrD ATPase family protein [Gordonia bronchialis]ACY21958.1 ATPase BadF/BadG/BcrA/BcrD type [Gordonia bronchialis DSM 43247]MCC3324748.1 ATPase [Gordonia bronchialis]QGS24463.1 ATPase [Gordonia bronchialis]STQ64868.1 BadF/BadG/BcrA/BcrD ATPase family [Gordonia bronchialis]